MDNIRKKIRVYLNETGKSIFEALESIEEIKNISPRIKGSLSEFKDLITELKSYLLQGPSKTIQKVLELTGYKMSLIKEGTLESQMRIENIEELLNSAFSFENLYEEEIDEPYGMLRDYLESIALFSETDKLEDADRVLLMTLHNAKGLEIPYVFMTGMEENLFPHERSSQGDNSEIEEERRLCYVGITRAEKKLYLTYSNTRTMWGGTNYYLPSRFIDEAKPYLKEIKIHQESTNNKSNSVGSLGKKVIHEKYGSGIVEEVNGNEITVNFGGEHGIKHLDIEWAPIIFE